MCSVTIFFFVITGTVPDNNNAITQLLLSLAINSDDILIPAKPNQMPCFTKTLKPPPIIDLCSGVTQLNRSVGDLSSRRRRRRWCCAFRCCRRNERWFSFLIKHLSRRLNRFGGVVIELHARAHFFRYFLCDLISFRWWPQIFRSSAHNRKCHFRFTPTRKVLWAGSPWCNLELDCPARG